VYAILIDASGDPVVLEHARLAQLRRATFASLSTRNYRLYFFGQLVSVSGTWMQTIAQSFLVLDLTHSGSALGLVTGARFAPIFLFGPWGGLIADRLDKRRVLYATQSLSALVALAFAALVAAHVIDVWMVFVLAGALGLVNVFDTPARQSFISELVPSDQLANAVTLNSITVNLARILGAALGGGVAALLGLAACFGLNALSFGAVLLTLVMMSSTDIARSVRAGPERGQLRAGFRYVRDTPRLLLPLTMITIIGTLAWEFQVSLPLVAGDTFHGGAGLYGAMTAAMGAGAVVGGLVSAARGTVSMGGLGVAAIGWGIAITAAALAPSLPIEFAVLTFVGYGSVTFNSYAKTALQLASAPEMRGRVMALWGLAWLGSTPIGGPIIGWIGEEFGARWTLLAGGLPTLFVGLIAYPLLRRLDRAEGLPIGSRERSPD
jgi:MFS family permease